MNKKKLGARLLSTLDSFEEFSKLINKRLNTNKLIKKIESLAKNRLEVFNLLNIKKNSKRIKSILNKKINLPTLLTTDSFSKALRDVIKKRYGITSKFKATKLNQTKTKTKTKTKNYLQQFTTSLSSYKSIFKTFTKGYINKIFTLLSLPKLNFKSNNAINRFKGKTIKIDKNSDKIGVAFYSDHFLTLASLLIDKNNKILVKGVIEVPVPGDIIGDSLVEDKNELANIILDSFNILDLDGAPLLVILASSFFQVNTFFSSELKQISNTDYKIQSKSPYLPNDTFVEFRKMLNKSNENKLIRTIYARRQLIESWTDTLEILKNPIIGITPSAPNIYDLLRNKISDETIILIDIEITTSVVLIGRNSMELSSHKLPYGSSLYSSDINLSKNYFSRLINSLELILSEYEEKLPSCVYIYGKGLDDFPMINIPLPDGFRYLSEFDLGDYSYKPNQMEVHESVSKVLNYSIETLALISSCL